MLVTTSSAKDKDKYQRPGPIHLTPAGEKWAEKTLHKLTLEEKVGQVFMIWCRASFLNVENPEYLQLREAMEKYHVGSFAMTVHVDGPFLLRSEPYEAAELLNRLQSDSKLPLLFAADFERGVSMRLMGATVFPHAMAFGGDGKAEDAEAFGRITAEESRAIGIHWNFFPDADVNSNPANPIINTRSFGEDPKQVGDLVAAYIKGAHEGGMLTTVKHFPGHGDTATDSHLGVASVNVDRAHLDSIELPPFRQAIAAGVDAVMVAHVTVPALDPDPNHVATISPVIVSDLLEKQLGFKGIVVTDALDMAGLTHLFANNIGRAAVEAFKAGNDLLLIPADFPASYNAMVQAVRAGEISRERLDRSVLKILKTKASLGLQDGATGGSGRHCNRGRQAEKPGFRAAGGPGCGHAGARQRQGSAAQIFSRIPGNREGRTSVYNTGGDTQSGCSGAVLRRRADGFRSRLWPRISSSNPGRACDLRGSAGCGWDERRGAEGGRRS